MAATSKKRVIRLASAALDRYADQSAANTALTVTTPTGSARRLLFVTAVYSAAPTQTGVTVGVDSGAGAAWDATLNTGTANAQTTVYIPANDVTIGADDAYVVTAPAGGAGITCAVAIYTLVL